MPRRRTFAAAMRLSRRRRRPGVATGLRSPGEARLQAGLRSLHAACASPSMAPLVSKAGSRDTGRPSRVKRRDSAHDHQSCCHACPANRMEAHRHGNRDLVHPAVPQLPPADSISGCTTPTGRAISRIKALSGSDGTPARNTDPVATSARPALTPPLRDRVPAVSCGGYCG